MTRTELRKIVRQSSNKRNGRMIITCSNALSLAAKARMPAREVGKICDELGIKIRRCKLGCFP